MTLIVRRVGERVTVELGAVGRCEVGTGEVVGAFGCGRIVRVVWL